LLRAATVITGPPGAEKPSYAMYVRLHVECLAVVESGMCQLIVGAISNTILQERS